MTETAPHLEAISFEAMLRRLYGIVDDAYRRKDPDLLRKALDASYSGFDREATRVKSEGGRPEPTPIGDLRLESIESRRAIVVATFRFDSGPERDRVLLVDTGAGWRIGGIQSEGGQKDA